MTSDLRLWAAAWAARRAGGDDPSTSATRSWRLTTRKRPEQQRRTWRGPGTRPSRASWPQRRPRVPRQRSLRLTSLSWWTQTNSRPSVSPSQHPRSPPAVSPGARRRASHDVDVYVVNASKEKNAAASPDALRLSCSPSRAQGPRRRLQCLLAVAYLSPRYNAGAGRCGWRRRWNPGAAAKATLLHRRSLRQDQTAAQGAARGVVTGHGGEQNARRCSQHPSCRCLVVLARGCRALGGTINAAGNACAVHGRYLLARGLHRLDAAAVVTVAAFCTAPSDGPLAASQRAGWSCHSSLPRAMATLDATRVCTFSWTRLLLSSTVLPGS